MESLFGAHHGLDEKSMESLTSSLERENLPGFDYLEFKQALAKLQEMGVEESMAFKTAFATAGTMGLTKDKLLRTADHYKKVLAKEKSSFDAALEKQMKDRVDGKHKEVDVLKQRVEKYKAKIKELNAQIAKSEKTIANADAEIQKSKDSIVSVQSRFENTINVLFNQIDKDVEDINTYL